MKRLIIVFILSITFGDVLAGETPFFLGSENFQRANHNCGYTFLKRYSNVTQKPALTVKIKGSKSIVSKDLMNRLLAFNPAIKLPLGKSLDLVLSLK